MNNKITNEQISVNKFDCNNLKSNNLINKPFNLEALVEKLYQVFENDTVDIDYVKCLMNSYNSNPQDWRKYAKFDRFRYTRNLVDEGNGKFNLMILCWGEGHGSAIHDHPNSHCFMKILQGELCETRYQWPANYHNNSNINNYNKNINKYVKELEEISTKTLNFNEVCYINDSIGLHRVENLSTVNPAVSLHLYCPPYSTCSVFNKLTGERSLCKVTFWSKYGQHRSREIQENTCPEDN